MHVRGVLSHSKLVEVLRPYVVSFWGQSEDEPIPEDVQPLYDSSGFGHSNVRCFVLDANGKLLHGFNGFPGNAGNPLNYSLEQYVTYLSGQIARAGAEAPLPKEPSILRLPDVKDGVRLYIRIPGRRDSTGVPVVAALENQGEWAALARPTTPRTIDAQKLSRWLRLCYPGGVNEQLEPYKAVKGTLTLTPLGKDQAVLDGEVRMAMSETDYEIFEGELKVVITYGPSVKLRGALDGKYWRRDPVQDRWTYSRLVTAIESRPN